MRPCLFFVASHPTNPCTSHACIPSNTHTHAHAHQGRSIIPSVLCKTLSGNLVPLLTITDFSAPLSVIHKRQYIILSARVHPGETNASWMMSGVLHFLTSQEEAAQQLRERCVFKIVPMLNPDGVINGNHRCNSAGLDLNRQWAEPSLEYSPTIFHLKRFIGAVASSRDLALYCDFHGHSRKKDVFVYGCEHKRGTPERVFPRALHHTCPHFDFDKCSFKVSKGKMNCARVVVWKEFKLAQCYSIEASMAGSSTNGFHFSR
jgi:hypothetical protein